ncbi:MAG: response regulator [Ignavibacteriae bacterium]|nr:response regulator [Ignavibacteriota bacterium]
MDIEYPKILFIDDEKGLRLGTEKLLKKKRFDVVCAENGEKGIQLGTQFEFDVVLIDLNMPDINGLSVLKQLISLKPNTVYFIVTAYGSYESAIEATRLGAYNYFLKPFTPHELLHQIEKGLKHRKLLIESLELKKEREKNLTTIAHEKSRLNTIIEAISSGVMLINKERKLVYYNKACLQKLNFDELIFEEEIIEKLPPNIAKLVNEILISENPRGKSYTTEVEILPNNELTIEATCSRVPHPDGTFAGVVVVLKNITRLKQLETLKSQFVSMVAHELKTPLAAVLGYLDILTNSTIVVPQEKQKQYMQRSHLRLRGSLDLVNDLLDISRIETNHIVKETEIVSIPEIIKSCIEILELEIKKKNINILHNISEVLPKIKIDKNDIIKIFSNLLSNAIKYNYENGSVIINYSLNKNFIVVSISDTGIGLKEDEKMHLFQQFYRAKNKHTKLVSGTGLGLSIVKRLVDANQGKVNVESVYNEGSTFIIQFPFK